MTAMVQGGLAAALLGLVFGSLATALSHRLPLGLPVAADRSRCPHCDTVLGVRDLLPVLSWLLSRGRCRHCGQPVSWRYPAIELLTAALFVAAWATADGDVAAAALLALTAFALVVITVADLEAGIIPDAMVAVMIPLAIGWRWWTGGDWLDACLGSVLGVVITYGTRWAFLRWRGKDGLGLGDVKFMAVAGFYVGLTGLGWYLVLTGLIGLPFGLAWRRTGRGEAFPLGPALCAALLAGLMWLG